MSDQTNAPEITLTVTATVRIDPHLVGKGATGQVVLSSAGSGGQGSGSEHPKSNDLQGVETDLQRVISRGSSSDSQGTTTGSGKGELKGN
jgi:hypothetical protein